MHIALFIVAVVVVAILWDHFVAGKAKKIVSGAEAFKDSAEKASIANAEKVEQSVKSDVAKIGHEL